MDIIIFLLLTAICIGSIYLVHKYFGKQEFYILAIIYSILSFLMSFKMTKILGININMGIIFSDGLLIILYYFASKYDKKEVNKLLLLIIISIITMGIVAMLISFAIPSLYDSNSLYYSDLVFNSLPILVFYPIALFITLFISSYCFEELRKEKKNRLIKTLLTIIGIMFIDTFIFIYFSYAILIRFDISLVFSLDNYLVKTMIMILFILISSRIFKVKKVKE
ncbi:MAG: hypothetical protein ACI31S_05960 [Bacilli bacterium]